MKRKRVNQPSTIPKNFFKNQDFADTVIDECDQWDFGDCCWAKMNQYKHILRHASTKHKQRRDDRGAKTAEERIYWAIYALRASHAGEEENFKKAIGAAPQLRLDEDQADEGVFPACGEHIAKIRGVLNEALKMDHIQKKEEIESIRDTPGYIEEKQRHSLLQDLMKHNPKKKKVGIHAVRDDEGNPIYGQDESTKRLGKYWGEKFKSVDIDDEDKAREFIVRFSNRFPEVSWFLGWIQFISMMQHLNSSAPGPDGIPYKGWQMNFYALMILYMGYMVWMTYGYVPIFFNIAYLWLLPKTEPSDGVFKPGDTRPLTGSNCDTKIFAMAIGQVLNKHIGDWAIACQRGFIKGRCMLKNIIEVETRALKMARIKENSAAIIFLDFAAAFPSICRRFLWLALREIRIPEGIIIAIQALYGNNLHFVKTSSGIRFVFCAESGVMQGSPLSSLIFVLATDCLNRYLKSIVGLEDLMLAYADDIALVLRDVYEKGGALSEAFLFISRISNLVLNAKKCVCVPLWDFEEVNVRQKLAEMVPRWSDFVVSGYGKYLGFYLGPQAEDREWDNISRKMGEIVKIVLGLGLPRLHSILMYCVLGVSKVQFVAQLREPKKSFLKDCRRFAVQIMGGPGCWVPENFPHALKEGCFFPISIPQMEALCKAIRTRTSVKSIPGWEGDWRFLHRWGHDDQEYLGHPLQNWVDRSGISVLHRTYSDFDFSDFAFKNINDYNQDVVLKELADLQSRMYRYFFPMFNSFDLKKTLRDRFVGREWVEENEADRMASRAFDFLESIAMHTPPCVIFAVLNTYLNGWTTAARFQEKGSRCLICEDCSGNDSIEHYGSCMHVWRAFSRRSGKSIFPATLQRFLGLYAESVELKVMHAVQMYAVRNATNDRRAKQLRGRESQVVNSIDAGFRRACLYRSGLSRKLGEVNHSTY